MKNFKLFQVDAFAEQLFRGNPAAVMILDEWLDDSTMQSIAFENNLPETAFAVATGDQWHLRWFTPTLEIGFCGHATLATAHILFSEYGKTGRLIFTTKAGELRVEQSGKGYKMDFPAIPPEPMEAFPPEIALLLSSYKAVAFRNHENWFAVLESAAQIRNFKPDLAAIAQMGEIGLVITARDETGKFDFISRYFVPGAGIDEDPVTGSIHSTLVPLWAERLEKTKLSAFQASARGGILDCELVGDRVHITGNAVTYLRGEISSEISSLA